MILRAMALNPLLHPLDRHLEGLSLRAMKEETSVLAYADCVTIILWDKTDILKVTEIIKLYKSTTSALIKVNKTSALP